MRHVTAPLLGRRIVVTRPREQQEALAKSLRGLGATVIVCPAIAVVPVSSSELDACIRELGSCDRVVFTSANAARIVIDAWQSRAESPFPRAAAIGPETAAVLADTAIPCDPLPVTADSISLTQALSVRAGERILLPRSDLAGDALPSRCRAAGAVVMAPVVYRTVIDPAIEQLRAVLLESPVDAVTLASGSAARAVAGVVSPGDPIWQRAPRPLICCIGPATASAAEAAGFRVDLVSPVHTGAGMADALVARFSIEPQESVR